MASRPSWKRARSRGLTLTAGLSYNNTKIDDDDLTVEACGAPRPDPPPTGRCAPCSIRSWSGRALLARDRLDRRQPACRRRRSGPSTSPPGTSIQSAPARVYVFTDWYHRSKINFFLYKSVEFSDDQLLEGGLRIGYKTDRYDVAGFVRNITNDESAVCGIDFNNLTAMVNEPRIWGVEAGVKF